MVIGRIYLAKSSSAGVIWPNYPNHAFPSSSCQLTKSKTENCAITCLSSIQMYLFSLQSLPFLQSLCPPDVQEVDDSHLSVSGKHYRFFPRVPPNVLYDSSLPSVSTVGRSQGFFLGLATLNCTKILLNLNRAGPTS
jgi:hypothetical protein